MNTLFNRQPHAVAVIVGSAWSRESTAAGGSAPETERLDVDTPFGTVPLYRMLDVDRPAYILPRHGWPYTWYPQHIPYRAHAWALRAAGVGALLVTSSVGVLQSHVPLDTLLDVGDLTWPENRLPDGSTCTLFGSEGGHLVLREGLFSHGLREQVATLCREGDMTLAGPVTFAYAGGPRTKTTAENRLFASLGADVNSMTFAPEVVLAAEAGIACAGVVVGHKYSHPDIPNPPESGITASLERSRAQLTRIIDSFLRHAEPVPSGNELYRFS